MAWLFCLRGSFVATEAEPRATPSQTPSERRLELICFQCICGRTWSCDVISSNARKKEEEIAWQETGWLSVAVGSQPMKVVEGGGEGPVKQVCNLCVT